MATKRTAAKGAVTNILGIGLGAFAAQKLNSVIPASVNPKLGSAAKIALGAFVLPKISKGNALISKAGDGMIAVGVLELVNAFMPPPKTGPVSGINDYDYVQVDGLNDNSINGLNDFAINGLEDYPTA